MTAYRQTARVDIARRRKDLEALFLRVEAVDEAEEIVGDLNRYLCVRVSGFLEQSLVVLARSLCEGRSGGQVLRFAHSWLERAPNPRAEEVLRLVGRFDGAWERELRDLLGEDDRATRINSLLGIRNDVAHGKNQGVSRRQVWEYQQLVDELVDWLLDHFEPK